MVPSIFDIKIVTCFSNTSIWFLTPAFINNLPKPIWSTIFNFDISLFEVKISDFLFDLIISYVIIVFLHMYLKIIYIYSVSQKKWSWKQWSFKIHVKFWKIWGCSGYFTLLHCLQVSAKSKSITWYAHVNLFYFLLSQFFYSWKMFKYSWICFRRMEIICINNSSIKYIYLLWRSQVVSM